jgi:hypothetical protein
MPMVLGAVNVTANDTYSFRSVSHCAYSRENGSNVYFDQSKKRETSKCDCEWKTRAAIGVWTSTIISSYRPNWWRSRRDQRIKMAGIRALIAFSSQITVSTRSLLQNRSRNNWWSEQSYLKDILYVSREYLNAQRAFRAFPSTLRIYPGSIGGGTADPVSFNLCKALYLHCDPYSLTRALA